MNQRQRSGLAFGLVLILIGVWLLLGELVPGLREWLALSQAWPLLIVAFGVFLLIIGLLTRTPGMAVPVCLFWGIGGLIYYQNLTGSWDSWAYAWTLIPGFVGVGLLLTGLLENRRSALTGAIWLIVISLVLFIVFASFLGGPNLLGAYWPVLLIALGAILLIRSLIPVRQSGGGHA